MVECCTDSSLPVLVCTPCNLLPLHHLHLPGTFGTSLRYFANVAITAQCPFGCFPTRVGIFTAILGCAVLRLEKRCFAFAAADFGCLQLGLVGTFAAGILVLTVGPPTNLTGIKVVNQFRLGKVYKLYKYILVFKNVLVNACPKFNQTIVNLVVGQITNLGDVHKFCIFLRFEGRNDEKCTEVTINMHFQNTKIKT